MARRNTPLKITVPADRNRRRFTDMIAVGKNKGKTRVRGKVGLSRLLGETVSKRSIRGDTLWAMGKLIMAIITTIDKISSA